MKCKKCGAHMIKISYYDPEGTIPLYRIVKGEWICINNKCSIGKKNTRRNAQLYH